MYVLETFDGGVKKSTFHALSTAVMPGDAGEGRGPNEHRLSQSCQYALSLVVNIYFLTCLFKPGLLQCRSGI